jgi:hypothetical protein
MDTTTWSSREPIIEVPFSVKNNKNCIMKNGKMRQRVAAISTHHQIHHIELTHQRSMAQEIVQQQFMYQRQLEAQLWWYQQQELQRIEHERWVDEQLRQQKEQKELRVIADAMEEERSINRVRRESQKRRDGYQQYIIHNHDMLQRLEIIGKQMEEDQELNNFPKQQFGTPKQMFGYDLDIYNPPSRSYSNYHQQRESVTADKCVEHVPIQDECYHLDIDNTTTVQKQSVENYLQFIFSLMLMVVMLGLYVLEQFSLIRLSWMIIISATVSIYLFAAMTRLVCSTCFMMKGKIIELYQDEAILSSIDHWINWFTEGVITIITTSMKCMYNSLYADLIILVAIIMKENNARSEGMLMYSNIEV